MPKIREVQDREAQDREAQDREEWVMVGQLSYDYDAEIVSSLFQSQEIPMMIQGRNHRRMLGFIGGYIEMRVLVPKAYQERGIELFNDYHQQRDNESFEEPTEKESRGEGQALIFNETGKKMGIALFLSAFLGFGLASYSVGLWFITLLLAPLQALAYSPELCSPIAEWLSLTPVEYMVGAKFYLPLIDLGASWGYLIFKATLSKSTTDQDADLNP